MDKVFIEGLQVQAIIGVDDWERTNPQTIIISISLLTDIRKGGESDNISDCVNYDTLGRRIQQFVKNSMRYTVEALATDIAKLCLEESRVQSVTVRIDKPGALPAAKTVGVEIVRNNKEMIN